MIKNNKKIGYSRHPYHSIKTYLNFIPEETKTIDVNLSELQKGGYVKTWIQYIKYNYIVSFIAGPLKEMTMENGIENSTKRSIHFIGNRP